MQKIELFYLWAETKHKKRKSEWLKKKSISDRGQNVKNMSFSVFFKYFISSSIKLYFIHSCYNVSIVLMWGFIQCLLSLLQPPSNIGPCQSLCWSPLLNWRTNLVRVYANHHYQTDEQILLVFMLTTIIKLMNRSCQSLCWSPLSNWWTDFARLYPDQHYWSYEQIMPEFMLITVVELMRKIWVFVPGR